MTWQERQAAAAAEWEAENPPPADSAQDDSESMQSDAPPKMPRDALARRSRSLRRSRSSRKRRNPLYRSYRSRSLYRPRHFDP